MAPLTKARNTRERSGDRLEKGVKGSTIIYAGALVAMDATDFVVPGSTATTLAALGRAEATVDNSNGADGDLTVVIKKSIFRFNNSAAADEVEPHDIGSDCYIVDDNTVALTDGTGTRSKAGTVFDVDAQGVWVDMR